MTSSFWDTFASPLGQAEPRRALNSLELDVEPPRAARDDAPTVLLELLDQRRVSVGRRWFRGQRKSTAHPEERRRGDHALRTCRALLDRIELRLDVAAPKVDAT